MAVNHWLRKQLERAGWVIAADGSSTRGAHQLFSPDNTYDIGASGANRPKNIYSSSTIISGASVQAGAPSAFLWSTRSVMRSPSDGAITIANQAETVVKTLGGVLTVSTTQAGTTAVTTEEDLWTYSLPANTLSANGKSLRITVWGTTAANANTKNVRAYFGGTEVAAGQSTTSGANWRIDVVLHRTGASAEISNGLTIFGGAVAGNQSDASLTSDTTGAIPIKVTGQNGTAAANDIVFRGAIVEALN
jgi:hypothetical protein